jgi:hypothetical protein
MERRVFICLTVVLGLGNLDSLRKLKKAGQWAQTAGFDALDIQDQGQTRG